MTYAVDSEGLMIGTHGYITLLSVLGFLLIQCFVIVLDAVFLSP